MVEGDPTGVCGTPESVYLSYHHLSQLIAPQRCFLSESLKTELQGLVQSQARTMGCWDSGTPASEAIPYTILSAAPGDHAGDWSPVDSSCCVSTAGPGEGG